MEEKKVIKVRLSAVVIVVLIIAIGVMAYFLYTFNNDKNNALSTIEEQKKEISDLKQGKSNISDTNINTTIVENKKNNEKVYDYKTVSGLYTSNIKIDNLEDEAFYSLYLFENGMYKYEYGVMVPSGTIGNYVIEGNKIILNELFSTGSDVSTTVIPEKTMITISINEDGSLADNNNVISVDDENIKNKLNNVNLKKETEQKQKEYINAMGNINKYLNRTYLVNNYSENQ